MTQKLIITDEVQQQETALLVALQTREETHEVEESLAELAALADTAGAQVVGNVLQKRSSPDSAFYIGKGKAQEIGDMVAAEGIDLVIFDDELSPSQVKHLGEVIEARIIDRTQLILDIFAQRAQTKEGKLQVELAQLTYMLPRLIGRGTELSRLGGGIGTRGPGETKLEQDRRRIRDRIADLKADLEEVRKHRSLHRQGRRKEGVPVVALVGYTNAGKSTLLNTLCDTDVLAENKLFATLDPTTRRLQMPNGGLLLLTDTVGFIRKLPHHLVAAFRATLEELADADLLLHVVDISSPSFNAQMETVYMVLEELKIDRPILVVFNKVDRAENFVIPPHLERDYPRSVFVAARSGQGLDKLLENISEVLLSSRRRLEVILPYHRGDLMAAIYDQGHVIDRQDGETGIHLQVEVEPRLAARIEEFQVTTDK